MVLFLPNLFEAKRLFEGSKGDLGAQARVVAGQRMLLAKTKWRALSLLIEQ
jgi:hypothetical protein